MHRRDRRKEYLHGDDSIRLLPHRNEAGQRLVLSQVSQGHRGAGIPIAALHCESDSEAWYSAPTFLPNPATALSNPVAPVRPEAGVVEVLDYHFLPNR